MRLLEKIGPEMEVEFAYISLRSINFKRRSNLISTELEALCLEITKPHSKPFLVTTIYRPPNATAEFFDHLEKLIKQIDDKNKKCTF